VNGVGIAASFVVTPSFADSHSNVVPCRSVDASTAKKTTSKNSSAPSTPAITGNVASTTGTAPRSPAHPSAIRSGTEKPRPMVPANAAIGRATNTSSSASRIPSSHTAPKSDGKTSSPRTRNMPSCATHARPSWKVVIVRRAGVDELPITRPVMYTARKPDPCRTSAPP
jgi:hypothetical protein